MRLGKDVKIARHCVMCSPKIILYDFVGCLTKHAVRVLTLNCLDKNLLEVILAKKFIFVRGFDTMDRDFISEILSSNG